jgi:hypothetical protein
MILRPKHAYVSKAFFQLLVAKSDLQFKQLLHALHRRTGEQDGIAAFKLIIQVSFPKDDEDKARTFSKLENVRVGS